MPSEIRVNKYMLSDLNLTCIHFPEEGKASFYAIPVWNLISQLQKLA